jgi:hypothetical protein
MGTPGRFVSGPNQILSRFDVRPGRYEYGRRPMRSDVLKIEPVRRVLIGRVSRRAGPDEELYCRQGFIQQIFGLSAQK